MYCLFIVSIFAGECLAKFTNKKTPYCVRFNPDEDKQNLFLVGCADKKIYCVSECYSSYSQTIVDGWFAFSST